MRKPNVSVKTRYQRLSQPYFSREMYHGSWNGRDVMFPRVFRGHRFTEEECATLCRGEALTVRGLRWKGTSYDVVGRLMERVYTGGNTEVHTVSFAVDHPLFGTEDVPAGAENSIDTENLPDLLPTDDEAQLAAMLDAPVLPPVKRVTPPEERPPVYVPVTGFEMTGSHSVAIEEGLIPDDEDNIDYDPDADDDLREAGEETDREDE